MVTTMTGSKLWMAYWEHTWGEAHGIIGIYSTPELAEKALERYGIPVCPPRGFAGSGVVSEWTLDVDSENLP